MRFAPLFLLAGSLALFTRCTTNRFYTPNTVQVPMLTHQHEATISAGISKNASNTGIEAQGIYSPLPHVGIMASHFDVSYKGSVLADINTYYLSEYKGESHFNEAGLGGYYQVGPSDEYLLSLFAGYGRGHTLNRYSPPPDMPSTTTYDSRWDYSRFFVQPSLSLKYKRFEVGTALRFAWIAYFNGDINSRMGLLETERIQLLVASSPLFLTEMAWTASWHLRPVVLSLHSTGVVRGKSTLRDLELASNYVSMSVGLNLHELFGPKEKVKKTKH